MGAMKETGYARGSEWIRRYVCSIVHKPDACCLSMREGGAFAVHTTTKTLQLADEFRTG